MKIKLLLILGLGLAIVGCNNAKGEATDLAKACDPANDGKYVEVKGVLDDGGSLFCSNIGGGDVKCGFSLLDKAGGERKMGADVVQGSYANTVTEPGKSYKKADLKVRDNSGNQIAVGTDVVRLTGKLSVSPDSKACFVSVDRIEK